MSEGRLSTDGLVSGRLEFARALQAYDDVQRAGTLGLLLAYGGADGLLAQGSSLPAAPARGGVRVALVGAGNFAARTLAPALLAQDPRPTVAHVVSARGASALVVARQLGAAHATTDLAGVLADDSVRAVFLATRHHEHAAQTVAALRAGKAVWVEKPLALTPAELAMVASAQAEAGQVVMVGFNRRFAPLARHVARRLRGLSGPKRFEATINAGVLPADHWLLDPRIGGGRIVGEACHFIDLLRYWADAPIVSAHAVSRGADGQDAGRFVLEFADGSVGHIHYLTDLDPATPKERYRIEGEGWEVEIDNWTRSRGRGVSGFDRGGFWNVTPDKGHRWAVQAFLEAVRTDAPSPIPFAEILEVSRWALTLQATPAS